MHDTNPDPKKRMPPLIVLGLTGPVGSGCTTVGRMFAKKGNINKILKSLKWVNIKKKELNINWREMNKEIDGQYERLTEIEDILKKYDELKDKTSLDALRTLEKRANENLKIDLTSETSGSFNFAEQLKELEKNFKKTLTRSLEIREGIKALEELEPYHSKNKHYFWTISVSDLIVFRALMEIEKKNFSLEHIKDIDRKRKYEEFVDIAKKHMDKEERKEIIKESGYEGYRHYYIRLYEYESKSELIKMGQFFYNIYKITGDIKNEFNQTYPYRYSEVMQDFGDNIRQSDDPFGRKEHPIQDSSYRLAKGIAQIIYLLYKAKRVAFFVVDCLRNPYEVEYLKREFANFYLLSLYAEKETRKQRIINAAKGKLNRELTEDEKNNVIKSFGKADERDSGKGINGPEVLYKQNVAKCVQISDIAISNEKKWIVPTLENHEEAGNIFLDFCRKPLRIMCLILSPGCVKPTSDEMFMNMAYTMAVKSNCICRQVGAVIIGPKGYVVGAGWNDVGEGKTSCGLRAIRDLKVDEFKPLVEAIRTEDEKSVTDVIKRLIRVYENPICENPEQFCFCFKDEMVKRDITPRLVEAWHKKVEKLVEQLKSEDREELSSVSDKTFEKATRAVKTGVEQIIKELVEEGDLHQLEYCLALHAEENAIIQSSKIGGMGLKGGTIYSTAQPCSLCAKKIQQIGLSKVVYTEAYPKSLSEIYMKGVDLEQFEGVKPRAYIKLFMPHHDQKEWQELESQKIVPMI